MCSSSEEESSFFVKEENELDEDSLFNMSSRRSAFAPYRPVTVLTNLQRGNTEKLEISQTHREEISFHTSAGMGELTMQDFAGSGSLVANQKDENDLSLLMWASFYGQLPTVRLLLENHAEVDTETEDGETALLFASASGHHEIVRVLLDAGANPNHVDHISNSALLYAAYGDHVHCLAELLEKGADITQTNFSGYSAYKLAVMRSSKQVQILLEKYMLRMLEPV